MNIAPFAHAFVREKVLPAKPFELTGAFFGVLGVMITIPDIEQRGKIREGIVEAGVHLIGRIGLLKRPLPGVLDAQYRGNHCNLIDTALISGFQQHPGQPWV